MQANGSQKLYPMPGSDGMLGRLSAFGGSPQQKPMALLREVARPLQGHQLYVFALPER